MAETSLLQRETTLEWRIQVCLRAVHCDMHFAEIAINDNNPTAALFRISIVFGNLARLNYLVKKLEEIEENG